jgi:hypothetical protein
MSGTTYVPLKSDYYDDPKVIHAGEAAELLFVHMLAYCSRTFTDGFIDDAQMTRLGLKRVEKRAATLAQHALISRVDDDNSHGYRVSSWLKHNPSVREIAKAHEHESTAGKRGNHLRWHVQQGLVVDGCPWCKSCDSIPESDRDPDRVPDGSESGDPIEPESIDTETASETDTASSSQTTTAADPIPADNSREDDPRLVVVVGLLAKRETANASGVRNPGGYEHDARKRIQTERSGEIGALLRDRPSASVETIVDLLERGNGYYGAVPPAGTATLTQPPDKPRSNNQSPWSRRDPDHNRIVDEIAELGMFDEIPIPVRASWVENPAPLPPELMARARHQEDEIMEVAS